MDAYDPNYRPTPKQGMGCFAKGCITLLIVGFLLLGIGGFFAYQAYRTVRGYIADHPANVQIYPATDAEYQAVMQKMAPFANALQSNLRETLELTAQDINILVAKDPNFAHLKGNSSFAMAHDEIVADVSAPLDEDTARGKPAHYYFNGRLRMGVTVDNGELELLPHEVEVNGKPLPGWAMQMLKGKDFNKGFNKSFNESFKNNPKVRDLMLKLKSVRVVGDRLVLTSVGDAAVAPPPEPR